MPPKVMEAAESKNTRNTTADQSAANQTGVAGVHDSRFVEASNTPTPRRSKNYTGERRRNIDTESLGAGREFLESRNVDGIARQHNTGGRPTRQPRAGALYRNSPRGPYRQNLRRVALRTMEAGVDPAEIEKQVIGAARSLAQKLNEAIAAGHDTGAFMTAMGLAVAKDLLDLGLLLTGVGLIPGINFLVGLFLSSFLFFFMMGKGWMKRFRLKIKFWVLGLFVDGLPMFSALPINSLLVLDAWHRVRKRARGAEENMKELPNLTQHQLETLYKDLEVG